MNILKMQVVILCCLSLLFLSAAAVEEANTNLNTEVEKLLELLLSKKSEETVAPTDENDNVELRGGDEYPYNNVELRGGDDYAYDDVELRGGDDVRLDGDDDEDDVELDGDGDDDDVNLRGRDDYDDVHLRGGDDVELDGDDDDDDDSDVNVLRDILTGDDDQLAFDLETRMNNKAYKAFRDGPLLRAVVDIMKEATKGVGDEIRDFLAGDDTAETFACRLKKEKNRKWFLRVKELFSQVQDHVDERCSKR